MKTEPGHFIGMYLILWVGNLMKPNRERKRLPWKKMHNSPGSVIPLDVNLGVPICGTTVAKGVSRTPASIVVNVHRRSCHLMRKAQLYLNMSLLL